MPTQNPTVIPMLAYEDGISALEWLTKAFGFRERARQIGPDGKLAHGEVEIGNGVIILATPTPDYESPAHHRQNCAQAQKWSAVPWVIDGVLVYVEDIHSHIAHAKEAGATILSEIEVDGPGRRYRAEDPEGHRWYFLERNRD